MCTKKNKILYITIFFNRSLRNGQISLIVALTKNDVLTTCKINSLQRYRSTFFAETEILVGVTHLKSFQEYPFISIITLIPFAITFGSLNSNSNHNSNT